MRLRVNANRSFSYSNGTKMVCREGCENRTRVQVEMDAEWNIEVTGNQGTSDHVLKFMCQ